MFTYVSVSKQQKYKQRGSNQTYMLLHSKLNYKWTKGQPTDWEKIFTNDVTNDNFQNT